MVTFYDNYSSLEFQSVTEQLKLSEFVQSQTAQIESRPIVQMSSAQNASNEIVQSGIAQIIEEGRRQTYASINAAMIQTYWSVGRRIVEEEQHGEIRAEYGAEILQKLACVLVPEYGVNFKDRRLRDYRQFYLFFKDLKIVNSRVHNLTWTHFFS